MWQDFLFACAAYPEEEPLRGEVEAEARENVVRLMPHPQPRAVERQQREPVGLPRTGAGSRGSAGGLLGRGLLPRTCCRASSPSSTRPGRTRPGSPWSGSWDHHPNDPAHGTHHTWDVWNRAGLHRATATTCPRFVAEFGWQAPPAWATLRARAARRAARPRLARHAAPPEGRRRQRQAGPRARAALRAARELAERTSTAGTGSPSSTRRGRSPPASSTGARTGRCAPGTIVWQLNDCWPVTSWAAIDGDGRPKPLYYALRRRTRTGC